MSRIASLRPMTARLILPKTPTSSVIAGNAIARNNPLPTITSNANSMFLALYRSPQRTRQQKAPTLAFITEKLTPKRHSFVASIGVYVGAGEDLHRLGHYKSKTTYPIDSAETDAALPLISILQAPSICTDSNTDAGIFFSTSPEVFLKYGLDGETVSYYQVPLLIIRDQAETLINTGIPRSLQGIIRLP